MREHGKEKHQHRPAARSRGASGSFHDFGDVLAVSQYKQSPVICFVLLVALSFHSVVAGIALGIADKLVMFSNGQEVLEFFDKLVLDLCGELV